MRCTILKSNAGNAEYCTTYNMGHGYELNHKFLLYNVMMNVLWIEQKVPTYNQLQIMSNSSKS